MPAKSKKSKKSPALVFKIAPTVARRLLADNRNTREWIALRTVIAAFNAAGKGTLNWRRLCTSDGSGRVRVRGSFDGRCIGKRITIKRNGRLQVLLAEPRPERDPKKFNAWVMNIDPKTLRSLSVG